MFDDVVVTPNLEIAEAFWAELSPDDPEIRIRYLRPRAPTPTDKRTHEGRERTYSSLREGWPEVCAMQEAGWHTYYFVNRAQPHDGHPFARNKDVEQIRALFIDFDNGVPDDFSWHIEPNLVVKTSVVDGVQRGQALWLVRIPPRMSGIHSTEYADRFREFEQQLLSAYIEHRPDHNVVNAARILRLPGTLNLKGRPQLVTFEKLHDDGEPKPGYSATSHRRNYDDILAGIPPLPPRPVSKAANKGDPVNPDRFFKVLSYIDPEMERSPWRDVVWGIANTTIQSAVPKAYGEPETIDMLDVALRWSKGELFWDPRKYRAAPPSAYFGADETGGDDDIIDVFGQCDPTREDAPGFGTLVWMARLAGMPQTAKEKPRSRFLRPADLLALPDATPIVEGLLFKGENIAMVGMPKSGKSFLALDLALSIAAGLPAVQKIPVHKQGATVYMTSEGIRGFKRRLKAWAKQRDLTREQLNELPFYFLPEVPHAEKGIPEMQRFLDDLRGLGVEIVFVVIDTMARSLGTADENSASAATQYLNLVEGLQRGIDCDVFASIAHATNKGRNGDPNKVKAKDVDFRGSSGFSAGFDATWIVFKNPSNKFVKVFCRYSKENDTDEDLKTIFLALQKHEIDGVNSAVFTCIDKKQYGEQDDENTEIKVKKDNGADLYASIPLALKALDGVPGGKREWHEATESEKGHGGVSMRDLCVQILKQRGEEITEAKLKALEVKIGYHLNHNTDVGKHLKQMFLKNPSPRTWAF
jgi:hypothetical protein